MQRASESEQTASAGIGARPIAGLAALPDELPADVLILPREIDGDVGLYDDSVDTLAKELRSRGVTAVHRHEADSREWIGEKGIGPIVLSFIVGIASSAGWAGIVALARGCTSGVRARVARCKQTPAGTEWEWFEVEGSGPDVAEALAMLQSESEGADADYVGDDEAA
jgi:hypothetical protein